MDIVTDTGLSENNQVNDVLFENCHDNENFDNSINNDLEEQLRVGAEFICYEDMELVINQISKRDNFNIGRSHRRFKIKPVDDHESVDLGAIQRGFAYCTSCSPGHNIKENDFCIPYCYDGKIHRYKIKVNKHCLNHNHPIAQKHTEGFLINSIEQLNNEVIQRISNYSFQNIPSLMIQKVIKNDCELHISTRLINYIKYIKMKEEYGESNIGVDKLEKFAEDIKKDGGICKFSVDNSFYLKSLIFSNSQMHSLSRIYGDVIVVDGTYCISQSDYVLISISGVHPLGLNVLLATVICRSENSSDIAEALKILGFKQGTTMITDEAGCYAKAASMLNFHHVLCQWHYMRKVDKAINCLEKESRAEIIQLFNDAIKYCKSEDEINIKIITLEKFKGMSKKLDYLIETINNVKKNLCCYYTNRYLTLGMNTTSRGESYHSSLKRFVDASKFNIVQLLQHIVHVNDNTVAKIKELGSKQMHNADISTYVLEKFKEEMFNVSNCSARNENENDAEWIIDENNIKEPFHVQVSDQDGVAITSCSCSFFISTRLHCRHLICVFFRKNINIKESKLLERRWRLSSCPIINEVEINSKFSTLNEEEALSLPSTDAINLPIPYDETVRYINLKDLCDLVAIKCKKNAKLYQLAMINLTRILNETNSSSSSLPIIEGKTKKVGRPQITKKSKPRKQKRIMPIKPKGKSN